MTTTTTRSRAGTTKDKTKVSPPPPAPEKTEKQETVQQLKNRLRNEAEREVLDLHKGEVIERTAAKYKDHGLEYVRRLTDEEKAAKAIQEHLEKYPNLRSQFIQTDPAAEVVTVTSGMMQQALADSEVSPWPERDGVEVRDVE